MKRLAKGIFSLNEVDQSAYSESVLIVDSQQTPLAIQRECLEEVLKHYPRAEIVMLTFPERDDYWRGQFPDIKLCVPAETYIPIRYSMATGIATQLHKRPELIVLSSLAVSPLMVALIFGSAKVILYNQWQQWWHIKRKKITEIFSSSYKQVNSSFSLGSAFKKIGLFFISLRQGDSRLLEKQILLVDNGYAEKKQIQKAVAYIKNIYPCVNFHILFPSHRAEVDYIAEEARLLYALPFFINRYSIARHMFRLRRAAYDRVFLLSLDATPIIATIFFKRAKIFLYNKYYQLWSIRFKSFKEHARSLALCLIDIFLFLWLVFVSLWMLIRRLFIILFRAKQFKARREDAI